MERDHLAPALSGDRKTIAGKSGIISYYVRGEGAPLLLLHSINAAASAYEMRPIYERVTDRRVFAPDLPGFGGSERTDRTYDPDLYVAAIVDMLSVISDDSGGQAIDAIALSLSCEFLARAVLAFPRAFERLVFITPTGFQKGADKLRGSPGSTRQIPGLLGFVSMPLLSDGLFAALTSRPSIRFFLQRTYGSKSIDEGLFRYAHLTAHQPGAKFAPLAFLSGGLFSADIRRIYERLSHAVWMPYATRGDFADFSEADWVLSRPNWLKQAFPTGALIHFERTDEFVTELARFLER